MHWHFFRNELYSQTFLSLLHAELHNNQTIFTAFTTVYHLVLAEILFSPVLFFSLLSAMCSARKKLWDKFSERILASCVFNAHGTVYFFARIKVHITMNFCMYLFAFLQNGSPICSNSASTKKRRKTKRKWLCLFFSESGA